MNFSRFLDIQAWWEVPSIAYFCSLFRTAFNLLDFDIEELEEALLTDGTEESASSLLTELIVRLLNGCLGNNDISAFNYQMYLRRLFRRKCQDTGRCNPFDSDIDFQFLPLRTKVEILYALCDFRLDASDVFELFKNLEAESLRVDPLGWDDNDCAYWYFYGTRLYREDVIKPKAKNKKKQKKPRENKKRGWFYGSDWLDDDSTERVWQVVCFTADDWKHLTEKFRKATSKVEKELYRSLSQNFLPEIPRLFLEKERLQRKRLLESAPRRTSSRVLQKIKQKEEESKQSSTSSKEEDYQRESSDVARQKRALRRSLLRHKSTSSDSSDSDSEEAVEEVKEEQEEDKEEEKEEKEEEEEEKEKEEDKDKKEDTEEEVAEEEEEDQEEKEEEVKVKDEMPQKASKRSRSANKRSKNSVASEKGEPPPPVLKRGRKTNNSLAAATGQIVIPDNDEPVNSTRKKLKTSQIFSQTEEDIQTDMYKVLEQLSTHEDAWPFMDPVEEEYAPNYYAVIRRPMDLRKMEERLDSGYYTDFSMFKGDFKLIVNNCRLYNGQDNEYTLMVDKLQAAFDRLTEKYMHRLSSSDEEIAVEYQLPTPSRKHKLKPSESPTRHKRKKRKSNSDAAEPKSSSSDVLQDEVEKEETESKTPKESHKNKEKKKRKGHHRHGKHSKTHKKQSRKHSHGGSSKSKHNKKHGKKSKQKKKKNKHHEPEPEEVEKRSATPESIESSNRSRSASPLPSIHTPSPSPTELDKTEKIDQLSDPDFYKDKYDKIKERRRHTAKETWESLFDFKQKAVDKQKQNVSPEKNKNQKLRETIEKLRAKNEKYKSTSLFNSLFGVGHKSSDSKPTSKVRDTNHNDNVDLDEESEQEETHKEETNKDKAAKKSGKKSTAKNESASEALEQAVKDISKWLNDAPKGSAGSTPCDSPTQTISTEEHDNSRLDDELSQSEKSVVPKKDTSRKRPSSREPKLLKRREIQRTIDRLQPGKSKGNLLTNVSNKNSEKVEEITSLGPLNKPRDVGKGEELSPKLSLGSVLPTVKFTLGNDHNFGNNEGNKVEETKEDSETSAVPDNKQDEISNKINIEQPTTCLSKKDAEVETEPQIITKPSQEKATPNLSAWFKAFGAPKSNSTGNIKKKAEDCDVEDKVTENSNVNVEKSTSPKNTAKYDSPVDPDTPNPDEGDSPLPNVSTTPRQRRTSTGSSVSERSSFSQDLDSPRHQMSHTSPLLRSPASPRTDDFQKITYPIINGTVRAGFYQDTTSVKSSPEKSCSPREAPQSPYSPYSQHVYASNNVTGSATPNYFVDHNKSPLPTYGQNSTPYYDMSRNMTHKARIQDDYGALTSDTLPNNQYSGPFSPIQSAYQQPHSNYPQNRESPQPPLDIATPPANPIQNISEPKTAPFPVKKRIYNEPESTSVSLKKVPETKERSMGNQNKVDYPKIMQSPCQSLSATSVDDIALALSEKTEINNKIREKPTSDIIDRHIRETRDNIAYDHAEIVHNIKKDARKGDLNKSVGIVGRDNVDMVNMGYMNPENDRRNSGEVHDIDYSIRRDMQNMNPQQNVALNLGINHQMHKTGLKPTTNPANISLSHTHDRSHADTNTKYGVQNMVHAHHNQYEALPGSQSHGKFSLNDIELANKKLFACNTPNAAAAIDYGNWKMTNQMRKQDVLPSDYSNSYSNNSAEKLKSDLNSPTAYKNLQHPYTNYNVPRSNMQRSQDLQQNLSSELRIPNPRGLLKTDHMASHAAETDLANKNMDTLTKTQKVDKHTQNHPLVNTNPYKTSYSTHSSIPLESLRNIPNIPQILERYTNEERYLSSFAGSAQSLYHDKTYQMAQMFTKSMASEVLPTSTSVSLYSQPLPAMNKESSIYKTSAISSTTQNDSKAKNKRKKATETKQTPTIASQGYHASTCASDVLTSVKSSMMSASPFNFGAPTNMTLTGGLYGDNGGFSIEDIRNSNQLMAANYMAAAVAHQQRSNVEVNSDKLAKPAHQNSAHTSSSFPFMGHSQVRSSYPFVGADPTSPLYQQYLQRHQAEELLRQTGAQIMELYSPGYPTSLGVRQPYDPIIRPSWL